MEAPQVIQCHTSGRLIDTINLEFQFSRTRCDLAELRSVNEARSPLRERISADRLLRLEFLKLKTVSGYGLL